VYAPTVKEEVGSRFSIPDHDELRSCEGGDRHRVEASRGAYVDVDGLVVEAPLASVD